MNFAIVSLGCPKNDTDSEIIKAMLEKRGFEYQIHNPEIVIINTCAFIERAVEESMFMIYLAGIDKKKGYVKKIVVTGCLVNRYKDSLLKTFPSVDLWRGCACLKPTDLLKDNPKKIVVNDPTSSYRRLFNRNPPAQPLYPDLKYRYIRIAEGCDNSCSFCIIPQLRGRFQSRKPKNIINEVKKNIDMGIKEIILVAQDLTDYGKDIDSSLKELLSKMLNIKGDFWIRMLYLYPGKIDRELIELIKDNRERLLPYFDIPIQHIDDEILSLMNRKTTSKMIKQQIEMIREIPDAVIRTTVMVGFPGEDEEKFKKLLSFIRETDFEKLGAFEFSNEKSIFINKSKEVKPGISRRRHKRVMMLQQRISKEKNRKNIGKRLKVLIEGFDEDNNLLYGRSYMDSPEIDGIIWLKNGKETDIGKFKTARIKDAWEYDLLGEIVD